MRILLPAIVLACSSLPVWAANFEAAANLYRDKNYAGAFEQFLDLAESGDARAQTVIAMMYKYGESVPEDPQAAFDWYLKAAEAGYAPAMFNVGEMYREGKGVPADRTRAIEWLTRAAGEGFERANDSLARLNAEPVTSDKRSDPAVPWSKAWNFRLPNDIRFDGPDQKSPEIAPGAIYRAQLGAMRTRAAANRLWRLLAERLPSLFEELDQTVLLAEMNQQRVYRVQAGPFEDLRSAREFCERLKRAEPRAECLPVR